MTGFCCLGLLVSFYVNVKVLCNFTYLYVDIRGETENIGSQDTRLNVFLKDKLNNILCENDRRGSRGSSSVNVGFTSLQ